MKFGSLQTSSSMCSQPNAWLIRNKSSSSLVLGIPHLKTCWYEDLDLSKSRFWKVMFGCNGFEVWCGWERRGWWEGLSINKDLVCANYSICSVRRVSCFAYMTWGSWDGWGGGLRMMWLVTSEVLVRGTCQVPACQHQVLCVWNEATDCMKRIVDSCAVEFVQNHALRQCRDKEK